MVNDIRVEKLKIRELQKKTRHNFDLDEKLRLDSKIARRVFNLWSYRECQTLLIYVSNDIEVNTRAIIEDAWKQGKNVAVPKCVTGTRDLDFYLINSYDDLEIGAFGILEPRTNICEKLTDFSSGLCIVPALSFDQHGYRLGYGGGYYDRFLNNFCGKTVGICYDRCMSETLPYGKYDKKVNSIVTESKVYLCK